MRQLKLLVVLIITACSFQLKAATIKGFVTEKSNGEPLSGAIVILKNTKIGTASGLDGSFEIKNVAAGSYDVEVKYASFETLSQHITLKQDEVLKLDLKMVELTSSLKEVEIKAKHTNGSDEQARSREKNADELMNIMSAKTIELSPDVTVANVLQRVSGVTVQRDNNGEAKYATIRGMDKRYNYTTIDGMKIPSPDDKQRYVPMDIFPAEIVDRVEVIKSLTPSMEGDAMGGVMNMALKDAPEHYVVNATAATGYNENLFSQKFNLLDASTVMMHDPTYGHTGVYNAVNSDFNRASLNTQSEQAPPNSLFSLTIGNRFLKNKKLGLVFSGSYQNTYKYTEKTFFNPAQVPVVYRPIASDVSTYVINFPQYDDVELYSYSIREQRLGLHAKADYKFNDKNSIAFYALMVQLNTYEQRYIVDSIITAVNRPGIGQGNIDYLLRTTYKSQSIYNFALEGKHLLLSNLKLDWKAAYTAAEGNTPGQTLLTYEQARLKDTSGNYYLTQNHLKSIKYYWEDTKDANIQAFLNLTYTPTIFEKNIEFKTGMMYRHKERNNYYNSYTQDPAATLVPYNGLSQIYDSTLRIAKPTGNLDDALDYKMTENIMAYYIQAKLNLLHEKLEALGGVRIESTDQSYTTNIDPYLAAASSGSFTYLDVLPSANLKYALNAKTNLRLSYFTSIARPGFLDVIPYTRLGEEFNESGNPYLRHSVAQNFDLRYEYFPKGIDQVLVGAFYKNITDPIEYAVVPGGVSSYSLSPVNGNNAINYGAELQITKFIHYFGISANYTYTHSSTNANVNSKTYKPNAITQDTIISVTETRPLQGQAEHVANISFIYKNPKIGLDAHLSWNYTGKLITFLSGFVGLNYWQEPTSFLSFSGEQSLGKRLSIYVKINNLLNNTIIVEQNFSNKYFTNAANYSYYLPLQNLSNGNTMVEKSTFGRNYLIGIRYKIK